MEIAVADNERTSARGPKPAGRVRTCVGCGERVEAPEPDLVRLILGPGGEIAVDPGDGGFGRGAHVHARPACLARAAAVGLPRAAKSNVHLGAESVQGEASAAGEADPAATVPVTAKSLGAAIADVYARRVEGLISTAVRTRAAQIGSDAVAEACRRGTGGLPLVIVACDAAAAAELTEVRRAVSEGRAIAWGTKASLAATTRAGRDAGVAVVAIESARIASALRAMVMVVTACRQALPETGGGGRRGGRSGLGAQDAQARPTPQTPRGQSRKQSRTERGS
jgi:predicted RNA-binding protein YlxR (DUF448 family)